jgi:hypothetical protein
MQLDKKIERALNYIDIIPQFPECQAFFNDTRHSSDIRNTWELNRTGANAFTATEPEKKLIYYHCQVARTV